MPARLRLRMARPFTPRQRRQVHQDRAEGMSLRALARKYGTTAPTVRRVLVAEGALTPTRREQ